MFDERGNRDAAGCIGSHCSGAYKPSCCCTNSQGRRYWSEMAVDRFVCIVSSLGSTGSCRAAAVNCYTRSVSEGDTAAAVWLTIEVGPVFVARALGNAYGGLALSRQRVEEAKAKLQTAQEKQLVVVIARVTHLRPPRSGSRSWPQLHRVEPHETCNNVLQLSWEMEHSFDAGPAEFQG